MSDDIFARLAAPFDPALISWRRFMEKVSPEPNTGCWLWIGGVNKQGYGNFWHDGKCWKAHRFSYLSFYGDLRPDRDVLHACDQPSCVNPAHLSQGTALANCLDMWAKGRGKPSCGQNNGNAVLTTDGAQRVLDLHFLLGWDFARIARKLGVSRTTVSRIVNGKAWRAAA